MAKFGLLCLVVLAALNVKALTQDELSEIKAAMMVHFTECNKEYGVSEDDMKEAKEKNNLDKIDSCLIGCIFKRSGLVNDKGLFDAEKCVELSNSFVKGEEDQAKLAEIITDCAKVNDEEMPDGEEGCERAKRVLLCFGKHKDDLKVSRR